MFLDKSNHFNFTIFNYNQNLELISKEGKSYFPILEKEQKIRINFLNEIKKQYDKINDNENNYTNQSLYNCLIITINLTKFLKDNSSLSSNNDLQQILLNISVLALNYSYKNKNNLKVIIYYFSNLFFPLFKEMKNVNHYLSIEYCYLNKILEVINENNIFIENEKYLFLKIILLCFGELFKNNEITIIEEKNQDTILYFFCEMFNKIIPNLMENYNDIKKLSSDTFSTKSTVVNTTISDNEILNNNEYYKDAKILIECLYYYIQIILKDVLYGKKIYSKMDDYYLKNLTNDDERNKYIQIILILTYKNLVNQKKKYKIFIYSLIEYIGLRIIQNLQFHYIYFYDILIKYYELILDNDDLKEKIMRLFSDIFMEEIKLENFNDFLFIKINDFIFKKNSNEFEIIVPLIFYISEHFINEKDENIKIKVLKVLSKILNKKTNKELYYTLNNNTPISNLVYQSDLFDSIFKNFNILTNKELENNLQLKIEYLNFYLTFLLFLNTNFHFKEIGIERNERKMIISSAIFHIYKVELISINTIDYISYILSLIQFLIYYLRINCIQYVNTSYVLFNYMGIYYEKFLDINLENYSYLPFLSYYIIVFILVNIIKIYKIQISLNYIHNNIISNIKNINENYSNILNIIDINDIFSNEYNKEIFEKLQNNLINNFSRCNNLKLNKNTFDKIIKIIYNNLFGNISILFSCIEPKIKNSDRIYNLKSNQNENISIVEGNNKSFFINSLKDEISSFSILQNNDNKNNNIQNQMIINNENNNEDDSLPLNINNISFILNDNNNNVSLSQDLERNIKY